MRGDVTPTSERLNLNQLISRLRFANRVFRLYTM